MQILALNDSCQKVSAILLDSQLAFLNKHGGTFVPTHRNFASAVLISHRNNKYAFRLQIEPWSPGTWAPCWSIALLPGTASRSFDLASKSSDASTVCPGFSDHNQPGQYVVSAGCLVDLDL